MDPHIQQTTKPSQHPKTNTDQKKPTESTEKKNIKEQIEREEDIKWIPAPLFPWKNVKTPGLINSRNRNGNSTSTTRKNSCKTRLHRFTKKCFRTGGRNNQGVTTVFHRGGGNKRLLRIVDFKRSLFNITGMVEKLEYDPNRTARIALIRYKTGIPTYILAPRSLAIGAQICASAPKEGPTKDGSLGSNVEISIGNSLPIGSMPAGTIVHNLELEPGRGGQLTRAAGTYAKIIKKEKSSTPLRPHSGKYYNPSTLAMGTIGMVSNENHRNTKLRKAGQSRWRGIRPTVRGVAMNPIDHPHGGGEGRSKGGRHPASPWGKLTKGKATSKARIRTSTSRHVLSPSFNSTTRV